MPTFRRNHDVPEWFQERFLPPGQKERKFFYLDLQPEGRESNGHRYVRNAMLRWEGGGDAWDEYGRKPGQPGFRDKSNHDKEWNSYNAFKGEFARVFGPKRRGVSFRMNHMDNDEDDPEYHKHHLSLERLKPENARRRKRSRP